MGKKRSAARRAAATTAPAASAPTTIPAIPAVPSDTRAALVDTPPAPAVRESPTNTQHPRVSHEADATRAPRAASPAHLPVETTLVHESANGDTPAAITVAIATPQTHERHASDPCPEPENSPPALTRPIRTSNVVPAVFVQESHVSQHADTLTAPCTPFPALSASAATTVAGLAAAIDAAGPPTVFFACPAHFFDRAEDFSHEFDALAPRTCPATSIEEIDEDLLENIIEDAQRQTRIEVRREVRLKALEANQERRWKEGLEEGRRLAWMEARVEVRQREQAWKDGYEQGRWDGYREGLEVARTEVSTHSRIDATIQADDATHPHPRPIDTSPANPRVDADVQTDDSTLFPSTPRIHVGVQADASMSPHSIPIDMTASPHLHVGIQADAAPSPTARIHTSVQADAPRTSPATSHVNAVAQTDDLTLTHATEHTDASTAAPHLDAGIQSDPHTSTLRACIGVQADAPAAPPSLFDSTLSPPTDTSDRTARIDTGIQADVLTLPDKTFAPTTRVHANVQTDTPPSTRITSSVSPSPRASDHPHASAHARARTVHEIEPDLLREILAAAIAKGEIAGLKKGKHVGFQDGMEAGWKSGTKEGREEGFKDGKKYGINEGREQYRLEVSRIPRAVAAVQTDHALLPTHINSTTQTVPPAITQRPNTQHCTIISPPIGTFNTPFDSFTTSSNDFSMSNNDGQHFSWADEASLLPITSTAPLIVPPPRDFSVLRSSSARPFDSLKRRARRSQPRPTRPSCSPRPFISTSEPVVTRRHPAGLRADRPSVIVSSSPLVPNSVKLEAPPLDWQGDPRLQELGRVLRGLGWVHVPGS